MANHGSFKKGEKRKNQGGARPGAGRKTLETKAKENRQAALAQAQLDRRRSDIMKEYIRLAEGGAALPFGGTAIGIIKDAVGKWIPRPSRTSTSPRVASVSPTSSTPLTPMPNGASSGRPRRMQAAIDRQRSRANTLPSWIAPIFITLVRW
jgi:hypothetical protein